MYGSSKFWKSETKSGERKSPETVENKRKNPETVEASGFSVSAVNENGRRRGVIKRGHGVLIAVGVLLADMRVYFPHGLRIRPAADLHGHLFRHVDVFGKRSEAVPEAMETDAGQIVREADSVDPFSDGFRVERDHGSAWGRFTLAFGQKIIKAVHHNGDIAAGGAVFGLRL